MNCLLDREAYDTPGRSANNRHYPNTPSTGSLGHEGNHHTIRKYTGLISIIRSISCLSLLSAIGICNPDIPVAASVRLEDN